MSKKKESKMLVDQITFFDSEKIVANDVAFSEFKKAIHEELELKYCYKGGFGVLINSTVNYVQDGDVTICNPYEIHANVDMCSGGRYYILILDLDYFDDIEVNGESLRRQLISGKIKFKNLVSNNEELQRIIKDMVYEMDKKQEHYKLCVQGLIKQLAGVLLRDCIDKENSGKENGEAKLKSIVVPALAKIHADYQKCVTLDELASVCGVSKCHFARVFKKTMGVTPVQYITTYRIDVAFTMLKNTELSCEEISRLCGFDDYSYFNRQFKKVKGFSPTVARKDN